MSVCLLKTKFMCASCIMQVVALEPVHFHCSLHDEKLDAYDNIRKFVSKYDMYDLSVSCVLFYKNYVLYSVNL